MLVEPLRKGRGYRVIICSGFYFSGEFSDGQALHDDREQHDEVGNDDEKIAGHTGPPGQSVGTGLHRVGCRPGSRTYLHSRETTLMAVLPS